MKNVLACQADRTAIRLPSNKAGIPSLCVSNKYVRLLVAFIFLMVSTFACNSKSQPAPTSTTALPTAVPTVVARVGSVEISLIEFQKDVRFTRYSYIRYVQAMGDTGAYSQQAITQLNDYEGLGKQVLDNLIDDQLFRQEAARSGITVSAEEVQDRLAADFNYFPKGTPTPSATDLITSSLPVATPLTAQAYATILAQALDTLGKETGVNANDLFYIIESKLFRKKIADILCADVPTSELQVHARHIMVADEATAISILARLKAGDDWSMLAAQYSTDTATKDNGGDLGWFGKNVVVPELEQVAFDTPVGSISEPVKSSLGWHLVQVLERGERPIDPIQVENACGSKVQEWLQSQRTETSIVIYDYWKNYVPKDPVLPQILEK